MGPQFHYIPKIASGVFLNQREGALITRLVQLYFRIGILIRKISSMVRRCEGSLLSPMQGFTLVDVVVGNHWIRLSRDAQSAPCPGSDLTTTATGLRSFRWEFTTHQGTSCLKPIYIQSISFLLSIHSKNKKFWDKFLNRLSIMFYTCISVKNLFIPVFTWLNMFSK